MSQVVSRNRDPDKVETPAALLKKSLLVGLHGAAVSTYGYAIYFQTYSTEAYQLYDITRSKLRNYGNLRFLTFNCLLMQFVAYSLCFGSHFAPKIKRPRDFFFTTFAFPVGMLVVSTFWAVWFSVGREAILPLSIEPYYPPWLNHITHTIIAPVNLAELLLVKHQYSSDRRSTIALVSYNLTYTAFLLYMRHQTGKFVYKFLDAWNGYQVTGFILGTIGLSVAFYKVGRALREFAHGSARSEYPIQEKGRLAMVRQGPSPAAAPKGGLGRTALTEVGSRPGEPPAESIEVQTI